jgi:hypothetical protein
LLKARTVNPGKEPLLENGSETTIVSRNRRETDSETTSFAKQQILNKLE